MSETTNSGLVAVGVAGRWAIDIHELTNGERVLFGVVVEHPLMTLQFNIQAGSVLKRLINFFEREDRGKNDYGSFSVPTSLGSLDFITSEGRLSVQIHGSDEFGSSELFMVDFDVGEQRNFKAALEDALEDAQDDLC
ncbi:MAG: hypothetical protein GY866_29715 [Proteobacteria bacterium]|nr:hypothetical protein [Pseudomonadota bacterium]